MKKVAIAIIILALIGGGVYLADKLNSSSNNNTTINRALNSNNTQTQNSTINNSTSATSQNVISSSNNQGNTENNSTNINPIKKLSTNNTNSVGNSNNTSSGSQSTNKNQGITVDEIPQGYGKFGDLVEPMNQEASTSMPNGPMFLQLTVVVNGQNVVLDIDVTNVSYLGNILILKGHYLNKPFEQFTYYVSNTSSKPVDEPHKNPEYTMYEFYNGVNTGIFKLNFQGAAIYGGLVGTFEHVGLNETYQCSGPFINPNGPDGDYLGAFPYYNGYVNNTKITFARTNVNTTFKEKYINDSNTFTVGQVPMPEKFKDKNYKFALEEYYNGQSTGLYLLNISNSTDQLNGIYIQKVAGGFDISNYLPVHLVPGVTPAIV